MTQNNSFAGLLGFAKAAEVKASQDAKKAQFYKDTTRITGSLVGGITVKTKALAKDNHEMLVPTVSLNEIGEKVNTWEKKTLLAHGLRRFYYQSIRVEEGPADLVGKVVLVEFTITTFHRNKNLGEESIIGRSAKDTRVSPETLKLRDWTMRGYLRTFTSPAKVLPDGRPIGEKEVTLIHAIGIGGRKEHQEEIVHPESVTIPAGDLPDFMQ